MAIVNSMGPLTCPFVGGNMVQGSVRVGEEWVWPPKSNVEVYRANTQSSGMYGPAYSPLTRCAYIVLKNSADSIQIINVDTGKSGFITKTEQGWAGAAKGQVAIDFNADGSRGFIAGEVTGLFTFDPVTYASAQVPNAPGVYSLVVDKPKGLVHCAHGQVRKVGTYDATTGAEAGAIIATPNTGNKIAINADGSELYAMSASGKCVYVIDPIARSIVKTITDTTRGIGGSIAGGVGSVVYSCGGDTIYKIDTAGAVASSFYTSTGSVFTGLNVVHGTRPRLYAFAKDAGTMSVFDISGEVPVHLETVTTLNPKPLSIATYNDGKWGISLHDGSNQVLYSSAQFMFLGPHPSESVVSASATEWQPATGWVNEPPLPEQPLEELAPIADAEPNEDAP
jgi:DNA-binding beta-propeller fold protein YncE